MFSDSSSSRLRNESNFLADPDGSADVLARILGYCVVIERCPFGFLDVVDLYGGLKKCKVIHAGVVSLDLVYSTIPRITTIYVSPQPWWLSPHFNSSQELYSTLPK